LQELITCSEESQWVWVCVIYKPQQLGGLGPSEAVECECVCVCDRERERVHVLANMITMLHRL